MAPGMSVARRPLPVSPVSFKPQPKNESARSSTPYRIYSKRKIINLPLKPTLHQAKPFGKPLIGYVSPQAGNARIRGQRSVLHCRSARNPRRIEGDPAPINVPTNVEQKVPKPQTETGHRDASLGDEVGDVVSGVSRYIDLTQVPACGSG